MRGRGVVEVGSEKFYKNLVSYLFMRGRRLLPSNTGVTRYWT